MIKDNLLGELEALGRTTGLVYSMAGPDGLPQFRNAAAVAMGATCRIQALEARCEELQRAGGIMIDTTGRDQEGN